MVELLQETKSLLQAGDKLSLHNFNRRRDVKDFYFNVRYDPVCQVIKVS